MAERHGGRRRAAIGGLALAAWPAATATIAAQEQAGITVLDLGDNLKTVNDGDQVQVIGAAGLAFTC